MSVNNRNDFLKEVRTLRHATILPDPGAGSSATRQAVIQAQCLDHRRGANPADLHAIGVTLVAVLVEKLQRNSIFEAVEAGGLDLVECTFECDDAEARVTHVPSDSYFLLQGQYPFKATVVVGESRREPTEIHTWNAVVGRVERWAKEVRVDADTPDLWAELERGRELFTGIAYEDLENAPFTPEEQAEIAEEIDQIKAFVRRTYSLPDAQMEVLEAKLDDIAEAARRFGRKDFLVWLLGAIAVIIIGGLLPPEAMHHILTMVNHALGHLFGGGGPPKLPPKI